MKEAGEAHEEHTRHTAQSAWLRLAPWPPSDGSVSFRGKIVQPQSRARGRFDICHVTRYILLVIKTFADKETQLLYVSGKSRRLPPDTVKRALRRLEYVDLAENLSDLRVPVSNRLHALHGDREGQHSISINDQWRICFRFIDGDAYDVEVTDYH